MALAQIMTKERPHNQCDNPQDHLMCSMQFLMKLFLPAKCLALAHYMTNRVSLLCRVHEGGGIEDIHGGGTGWLSRTPCGRSGGTI